MITGLDHAVLLCPDIKGGAEQYATLLGRAPDWQSRDEPGGSATALFRVANTAVELMAPEGDGPVGTRLRELLAPRGAHLSSLAFRSGDIEADHKRLERRGLSPGPVMSAKSHDLSGKGARHWRRFRCDDGATAGLKLFLFEPDEVAAVPASENPGSVSALDHIVINTPNPDRAAALYGARLGLDLRLDRTAPEWKTRFLFFRTGGLTFEVIHRLGEAHDPDAPDTIWGLTWAVEDIHAARTRLAGTGLSVSDIRTGRKPGTSVFTVRDGTLGVLTLFISHAERPSGPQL